MPIPISRKLMFSPMPITADSRTKAEVPSVVFCFLPGIAAYLATRLLRCLKAKESGIPNHSGCRFAFGRPAYWKSYSPVSTLKETS